MGIGDNIAFMAFEKIDILVNNAGITRDDLMMRIGVDNGAAVDDGLVMQ